MSALKNQKHEAYCHQLIEAAKFGRTQGQAYSRSGFRADGHAAEVAASRLLKRDDIRARLAELGQRAVKKTRTTVDALAQQFDEVFDGAMGDAQFGAAGSAAAMKAKLLGFMRDKLEVGGPGDFDNLGSPEAVLERLIETSDDPFAIADGLRAFADEVERHLAGRARVIEAPPLVPRPSESEMAVRMFSKRR